MPLFGFQETGASWLSGGKRRYLADDMGLGKTPQAITACDLVNAINVLVVAPGCVRQKWGHEFRRWSIDERHVQLITTKACKPAPNAVNVVSYNLLRDPKVRKRLYQIGPWDAVIADEAHGLKEGSSKQSQLMLGKRGVVDRAYHYWPLSGSPTPNNYAEWYTHLRKFGAYAESYESFKQRFCRLSVDGFGREKIVGGKRDEELRELLNPWVLRRVKEDVLDDLPDLIVSERYVEAPEKLDAALLASAALPEDVEAAVAAGPAAVNELLTPTQRRAIGLYKVAGTAEAARQWLTDNPGQKLVLFGHHPVVLDGIGAKLKSFGAVVVHGKSTTKIDEAQQRFQGDPRCRVFLGQMTSAGVGVDLVAASTVWIVEADWTPDINRQAIDRVRRIGQSVGVVAEFVVLPGTIDEHIQATYARKARDMNTLYEPMREKVQPVVAHNAVTGYSVFDL